MINGFERVIGIAMAAAMTFAMMGCGAAQNANAAEQEEQMIGLSNPFVDADSLEDAAKIAGFDMTAPDSLDGYSGTTIQAIENDLIQVIYGELDHNIYFRKAVGTEDIANIIELRPCFGYEKSHGRIFLFSQSPVIIQLLPKGNYLTKKCILTISFFFR